MIPYVNVSCDGMKRNSHVFNIHYNNGRYNEWLTRGNNTRCLRARQPIDIRYWRLPRTGQVYLWLFLISFHNGLLALRIWGGRKDGPPYNGGECDVGPLAVTWWVRGSRCPDETMWSCNYRISWISSKVFRTFHRLFVFCYESDPLNICEGSTTQLIWMGTQVWLGRIPVRISNMK